MKRYLGVKIIEAEPMNLYKFSMSVKGVDCKEENHEGYKVVYPDGYVSWSLKEVFEEAYREISGLTFGLAIEAMKKGHRVVRRGWNGKGMWLVLVEWYVVHGIFPPDSAPITGSSWIGMKTADNKFVPWLASQTDMLAEDWEVVE